MAPVLIRNVEKNFDGVRAVRGIDLDIPDNAFIVLVGPSGCGKSTTLRMVAGLEDVSAGEIWIGDRLVNDLPPGRRDIAMVFQNYALYPHMSVRENIAFGLRQRRMPKAEINRMVGEAADVLGITPLLGRKPRQLSGGQRQRVAMGRAMVRDPAVFLFDEPLSNLDAKLRVQMRTEIKRLHQTVPTTTIYVTHDQVEAMTLADQVVVMNDGAIEQFAEPQTLYHSPASQFVAGFIGSPSMNFFDAQLEGQGDDLVVRLANNGDTLAVPASRRAAYAPYGGKDVVFGIRPEHLSEPEDPSAGGTIRATVDVVEPLGLETLVYFYLAPGNSYCARLAPTTGARARQPISLSPDMEQMHLIDPATGRVVAPSA